MAAGGIEPPSELSAWALIIGAAITVVIGAWKYMREFTAASGGKAGASSTEIQVVSGALADRAAMTMLADSMGRLAEAVEGATELMRHQQQEIKEERHERRLDAMEDSMAEIRTLLKSQARLTAQIPE